LQSFRADCSTVGLYGVTMTWQQLFKGLLQVAQWAFLMPIFRNLAIFKVVWHEKMLFGMYAVP